MSEFYFNLDKWESRCIQYKKNKDGMALKTKVTAVDGKLNIEVLSIDQNYSEYKKMVKKLMLAIAKEAIFLMGHIFTASYAFDDDFEAEEAKNKEIVSQNTAEYLNILFDEGHEKFMAVISTQSMLLKTAYELSKIHYKGGWCFKGSVWSNGLWNDGQNKWFDSTTCVMNTLLGYQPATA